MSDQKRPLYTTPVGRLMYPFLTGAGRDYKSNGKFKYSTKLIVPAGAEADAFAAKLDEIEKDQLANAIDWKDKKPLFKGLRDLGKALYSRDEQTQDLIVDFSCPVSITSKKTGKTYSNRPRFFDKFNNPITEEDPNIGSGTTGRITFGLNPWRTPAGGSGIRLEPKGFQFLQIVEFSGGAPQTAKELGFEPLVEGAPASSGDDAGDESAPAGSTGEL